MKGYFYPKSIDTSILTFVEMFDGMSVRVFDKDNKIIGVKPVPVSVTPKEKIAHKLVISEINEVEPKYDNYLPRISIAPVGFTWDTERMRGKFQQRKIMIEYNDEGTIRQIYTDIQSVPWNISMELVVWSKYMSDAHQIFENIAPWFAPEVHASYKERQFNLEHKAKITLDSVVPQYVSEFKGENEKRIIQYRYSFTMETVLYKPMCISPEILCSIIKIGNVPCQKIPFEGDAIIADVQDYTDPMYPSVATHLRKMDNQEEYDLMAKYWSYANINMNSETCIQEQCPTTSVQRPEWHEDYQDANSCNHPLKDGIGVINDDGTFSLYRQEIITENGIMNIVSYRSTWNDDILLESDIIIPNEEYPT